MNGFKTIIASLTLVTAGFMAHADVQEPIWQCGLTFDVKGFGAQLIVGKFELKGDGMITCADIAGNTQQIPVKVTMGSHPVSPTLAIGSFHVIGAASGTGLAVSPEDLLGDYYGVGADAALIVGAGTNVSMHGTERALTLNGSLQLVSGLGLALGFENLTLSPTE